MTVKVLPGIVNADKAFQHINQEYYPAWVVDSAL